MDKMVNLEDFYNWYELNQERFRKNVDQEDNHTKLRKEFIAEWPLERLLTMSIDDYVIGKGSQTSFCYAIEQGKYKHLFIGIAGGAASKFGIYWNKEQGVYKDQNNKEIPDFELNERFERLKLDLHDIVEAGINLQFDNPVFDIKNSANQFISRPAMVIKLLCIYSKDNCYVGVNTNSNKELWNKILSQKNQGASFRQNHEICQLILEKYPDLNSYLLGGILFEYSQEMLKKNNQEKGREMVEKSDLSKILLASKNIILRGAPGTGKTYLAKQIARELTDGNEEQIDFVQFHPSYDYTDFVEGLRPVSQEDGQIGFKLQDGIFKEFCQKAKKAQKIGGQDNFDEAWDAYLAYINNSDEKVYLTKTGYFSVNSRQNLSVNYDSGASGWVLPRHYVYELYKNKDYSKQTYYKSGGLAILQKLQENFGLKPYKEPTEVSNSQNFVFIIDEINRGEISKIFGELFFSLDPGYRGRDGEVSTQYANLHETDEKFYIPENVYIIGTMNDIDRSVDTFDFAMRRRFRFVEITAESQLGMLDGELGEKAAEAKERLQSLNQAISEVEGLNSHYHIGPSYFLQLKEVDYETLWSDYLQPLLEDYLRGTYDEAEKLQALKAAYDRESKVEADETDR